MEHPFDDWVVRVDADTGPLQRGIATCLHRWRAVWAITDAGVRGRGGARSRPWRRRALTRPAAVAIGTQNGVPAVAAGPHKSIVTGAGGRDRIFARRRLRRRGWHRIARCRSPTVVWLHHRHSLRLPAVASASWASAARKRYLPLKRGSDGRLGVSAQADAALSITFNVTAADADSFVRSESQIAAMLSRAVAQGQRNL